MIPDSHVLAKKYVISLTQTLSIF